MSKFKNIVVATDFSDISDKAFFTAIDLAKGLDANLHVIHIVQIHPANIPESGMVNVEELQAVEEQAANENLDKSIEKHGQGLNITKAILHGDPATQVNKVVKEVGADMIVMGTHGRTGIAHLVMGSVAESVLKNSEVPVMCIKGS
jgi:nucleotide-binding universal stress UspA family protein